MQLHGRPAYNRAVTVSVAFNFFEETSSLKRRGRLRHGRCAQARVPDYIRSRRRPMFPYDAKNMAFVNLGQIQML